MRVKAIVEPTTRVRNDLFDASQGLDRGRPFLVEALWYLLKCSLFLTPLPFPSALKRTVLRLFGAEVGQGVVIKPRVNIHFPWKLIVGDFSWIGEEVVILNFEPVKIGAHCCLSQRAFLCTGNHDYRQPNMPYRNRPITIEDGVWIGAQVFVSPGVTIGSEAVITAGSTVQKNQPSRMVCTVAPVSSVKPRWPENNDTSLPVPSLKPCSIESNIKPNTKTTSLAQTSLYRQILGVSFFVGEAGRAVEIGAQGGLVVVPAAPALIQLESDVEYRRALQNADLAITDSGFMVILWRLMTGERIQRVSGLEYLRLLLSRPDVKEPDSVLWVMPSPDSMRRNLQWLQSEGYSYKAHNCYIAPKYSPESVVDDSLVSMIDRLRPRHVIIALGGGTQEKLGLYLRQHCQSTPAIHCIGAAIGFLTGDQVRIPRWADQWILGWLFRCISDPGRFVPRYTKALRLSLVLWRYRSEMPTLTVVNGSN